MTSHEQKRELPFRGHPQPGAVLRSLPEGELEAELTIAAAAPGNRHSLRFEALLAERNTRRRLRLSR